MANQKISQMQEILHAKPEDLLYVVQDAISSNITVGNLFGKLPDMLLSGSLQLDTIESVVSNGGDISDLHVVTALTVDNMDREFFISSGTASAPLPNFMVKVLYLKTTDIGRAIVKGGFISQIDHVALEETGDSAILMSTPLGWIVIGGNAKVVKV